MRFSPIINRYDRPERIVVLSNPCASHAGVADGQIAQLEKGLPKKIGWVTAETKPDRSDNTAQLHQLAGKATILLTRMGDGGLNDTLAALFDPQAPPDILSNTTILPVGEGNKNDIAHMLLGRSFRDPIKALGHGRVARVHPLKFTFDPSIGQEPSRTFFGLYSAGINFPGEVMRRINSKDHREKQVGRSWTGRLLEEAKVSWRALSTTPDTKSGYNNSDNQKVDLMIANGDRMAGGQLKFPIQLEQTGFFVASTESRKLAELIMKSGKIVRGIGDLLVGVDSHTEIYIKSRTPAQVDGEDFILPPGRLTVELAENSVRFITTKPKRNLR